MPQPRSDPLRLFDPGQVEPDLAPSLMALLSRLADAGEPMVMSLSRGGVLAEVRVAMVEGQEEEEIEAAPRPRGDDGPATAVAAIVAVMETAEKPLKGSAIARRADRKYNPHFRRTLGQMRRAGILRATPDGYWLASRPLP